MDNYLKTILTVSAAATLSGCDDGSDPRFDNLPTRSSQALINSYGFADAIKLNRELTTLEFEPVDRSRMKGKLLLKVFTTDDLSKQPRPNFAVDDIKYRRALSMLIGNDDNIETNPILTRGTGGHKDNNVGILEITISREAYEKLKTFRPSLAGR